MNYYITRQIANVPNAGFKAPNDINLICETMGWKKVSFVTYPGKSLIIKIKSILSLVYTWTSLLFKAKKNDYILYQHPMYFGKYISIPFLLFLRIKKCRSVLLIHDIEHLRQRDCSYAKKTSELLLFNCFSSVICHNEKMKIYLCSNGISSKKIHCLNIFDYITSDIKPENCDNYYSVVVAGNLDPEKCRYIYEFANANKDIDLNLYGVNYEDCDLENVNYYGKYSPEELPSHLVGSFGLIWDGDSIDSCSGVMGNYLKFNNPHKLSLYLVSGIPVIVWNNSAIADFVKDNKCGIVVEDLHDLKKVINTIPKSDYYQMKESCDKIGELLKSGGSFKTTLKKIESD